LLLARALIRAHYNIAVQEAKGAVGQLVELEIAQRKKKGGPGYRREFDSGDQDFVLLECLRKLGTTEKLQVAVGLMVLFA